MRPSLVKMRLKEAPMKPLEEMEPMRLKEETAETRMKQQKLMALIVLVSLIQAQLTHRSLKRAAVEALLSLSY